MCLCIPYGHVTVLCTHVYVSHSLTLSLSLSLFVGLSVFGQVLARHIEPLMANVRAIMAHRKFRTESIEAVGTRRAPHERMYACACVCVRAYARVSACVRGCACACVCVLAPVCVPHAGVFLFLHVRVALSVMVPAYGALVCTHCEDMSMCVPWPTHVCARIRLSAC
jgi:hypothetical protein